MSLKLIIVVEVHWIYRFKFYWKH